MKANFLTTERNYSKILEFIILLCEKHMEEEREAMVAGHSDRSIGSGKFLFGSGYDIIYHTGSNKGIYKFLPIRIEFEGRRKSFKAGTEYFRPIPDGIEIHRGLRDPILIKGLWELVESSQPDRGLWD